MRVAVYYNNHDVRLEERPKPKIGPGEMLVSIEASGICGSDVMEWYRIHKAPLILGHEVSGVVAEVGGGIKDFKTGDRIIAAHHVPCNTCHYCLSGNHTVCETLRKTNFDPGGFAEYVRLPVINVDRGTFLLPDNVSFEDATFIEPLACVIRGQRRAGLKPAQSVLVIGSGISGLLHIKLACAFGAGFVAAIDISEYRLEAAKRFGAKVTIHAKDYIPSIFKKENNGYLADLVIVCTGATQAFHHALQSVERGGTVLFFAPTEQGVTIPLSINDIFWRNDITLTTSYAGSPADHMTALELIKEGRVKVNDMITHRFGLADTVKGFELVSSGKDCIKVIIMPQR